MSKAVITGGAGFLGSHLCERLLNDGYEVTCLDNFLTGRPANIEHLVGREGFRLVKVDVTEFVHVPGPVDVVLHFASPASPIDYLQLPIETMKVGSLGTLHSLGLAKEKGARFLLASTSETYGDPQIHPQPESYWGHVNPVGPRGVYDEAKRFAEALTMAYRRTHDVDTKIVRIFNSVLAGERVLWDDGTALRHEPVGELGRRLGSQAVLTDVTVPSFDDSGAVSPADSTWLVGHPTEQTCYRVTTRYGRQLSVTGEHSVFVRGTGGKPTPKPVTQLTTDDHVAIAGSLRVPERDRSVIDMLDVLAADDPWSVSVCSPELAGVGRAELLAAWLRHRGITARGTARQSAWGTVTRWVSQGEIPLGALQAVGVAVPLDCTLRPYQAGRGARVSRLVPVTDELLWTLGLYVAEGSWLTGPKTNAITIACTDHELDRAQKVFERDLGLHGVRVTGSPERSGSLTVNGSYLLRLFGHLGFGPGPKDIPGWVLGLPKRRLGWFLEGYREGDGEHSGQKLAAQKLHSFSTTSEALRDSLVVALTRFGLVASVGSTVTAQSAGDLHMVTVCDVSPWSPLDWHQGVTQTLQAQRYGDLVWAKVRDITEVPATELVWDFVVPGRENFWAGNGVIAHNTHGPRMRPNDGRAIPAFASQALRNDPITVAGDGSQTRSIIYVDDLIEGIIRLLHSDLAGPVNISNPYETSVLELAENIRRLCDSTSKIVFIPRPEDDPTVRQPDITLARERLGWEPQIGYEDGLRRTIGYFASHPEIVGLPPGQKLTSVQT